MARPSTTSRTTSVSLVALMLLPMVLAAFLTGAAGVAEASTPPPALAFRNFPAPNAREFGESGEPTIGVNWQSGNVMMMTGGYPLLNIPPEQHVSRISFDDSVNPPTATWTDVTPAFLVTNLDPILETDHVSGRTYAGGDDTVCNGLAVSTDDGQTWIPATNACTHVAYDHPTVGAGAANPNGPVPVGGPANPDGRVAYLCQDNAPGIGLTACAVTYDGGLTWLQTGPVKCTTQVNPGSLGHLQVGPDGNAYIPLNGCNGGQGVSHTYDGVNWAGVTVPGIRTSSVFSDPALGVGRGDKVSGGRLYFAASQGDGGSDNRHPMVSVSSDKGLSWAPAVDLSIASSRVSGDAVGVTGIVFPSVIAGDDDRAAIAFHGTKTAGDGLNGGFAGVWHLYVAYTYDAGAHWQTVDVTPVDPVQRGCISLAGTLGGGCDTRNLLDFMDVQSDVKGRVIVGYADGALPGCGSHSCSTASLATLARQSSGLSLFEQYDTEFGGSVTPALSVGAGGPYAGLAGNAISIAATAAGGAPGYTYAWTVLTSPVGSAGGAIASANAASTTFMPDLAGVYSLQVTATDTALGTASATATLVATTPIVAGCQAGGVTIASDATDDGGAGGDSTEAYCLRASDTTSTLDFYVDVKGKTLTAPDAPLFYDLYFSTSALGGQPPADPSGQGAYNDEHFLLEVTYDGTGLSAAMLSPEFVPLPAQAFTLSAAWEGDTIHVSWDRSDAAAPVDGDVLSGVYLDVNTFGADFTHFDRVPDAATGTYTVGSSGASGTGGPLPTCGDSLGLDGAGDSTQTGAGVGMRDLLEIAASDSDTQATFCWTVQNFADRPTGSTAADSTQYNVFFSAPYEGSGVAYSVGVVIKPDGTVDEANSVWLKGVCSPAGCLTGVSSGPVDVVVAGNTIRGTVLKTDIGSPQDGDSITGLSVDVRPSDDTTGTSTKDTVSPVADFPFGQRVPADTSAPSQVTGLAVTDPQTGDALNLAWSAASDNVGVVGYRVYRDGDLVATPAGLSYHDGGLTQDATYSYTVRAEDAAGNVGAASAPATGTPTITVGPDTTAPSVPTNLVACGTTTSSACVSWSPSSDDESGVKHYRVYRDGSFVATTTLTSYADSPLAAGTAYSYAVSAVNNVDLESAQSPSFAVSTLGFTGPELAITSPGDGATATPPVTIEGTYSTTGQPQTASAHAIDDTTPWQTADWVTNEFVQTALASQELKDASAQLSSLAGFLSVYPTTDGQLQVLLKGVKPGNAPTSTTQSHWPIQYAQNVGVQTLTATTPHAPQNIITLDDIRTGRAAPHGISPGVQDGIGPGTAMQMHNPIDGKTYICTASFLYENPATGKYYLQTAGHCLLDTSVSPTDSITTPLRKVDKVFLCYTGCVSNYVGLGTYIELDRTATYDPVAYAHQNGIGDDVGYVEIPKEVNQYLRPWMYFWSGPAGSVNAPVIGDGLVHFGHGAFSGTATPTQGRAAVAMNVINANTNSFNAAGFIWGGDSGSSIAVATIDADKLVSGGDAAGIITHATGANTPVGFPGNNFFGTTFKRGLDMGQAGLGFRPVLVTQDATIRAASADPPVTLDTAISTPAAGTTIADGADLAATGTATYPLAVSPGTGSTTYFLARDQCGAPAGATDIDDNPHLELAAPAVAGNCGSAAQPVGPVWESVIGPIADVHPAKPAPTSDIYVDQSRPITARVYFSCNARGPAGSGVCGAPSVVNDFEVRLSYGQTLVGSQRLTNQVILSDAAVAVDFSFPALKNKIPVGETPEFTVQVHQAAGQVFVMWGGATASYVRLPLGTVATNGVSLYVDVADAAHQVATSGTASWTATVPAALLPAGSHTLLARATQGATVDATPASVALSVIGVTHTAPTASFTTSVNGLTVDVTDTSVAGDGAIASRAWSWGDGSPAGSGATATHTYAATGTYTVTLLVTDAHGLSDSAAHDASVEAPATWTVDVRITNGATEVLARTVAETVPAGDGAWSYFFDQEVPPGTYAIEARLLKDGSPVATSASSFNVPDLNLAPTIDAALPQSVAQGDLSTFTLTATDPDGGPSPLSWTLLGAPSFATFDPDTQTVTLAPTFSHLGAYTVSVGVTDGDKSDVVAVPVTVLLTPRAPTMAAAIDTVVETATQTTWIHATTLNHDIVALAATAGLEPWMAFTDHGNNTASIVSTPGLAAKGVYTVTITADSYALTGETTATIRVLQSAALTLTPVGATNLPSSPGKVVTLTARLTNTGPEEDTIHFLTTSTNAWAVTGVEDVTLAPGEVQDVTFTATVPSNGDKSIPMIRATSDGNPNVYRQISWSITVKLTALVTIDPPVLGKPVTGNVTVKFGDGTIVPGAVVTLVQTPDTLGSNFDSSATGPTGANGRFAFSLDGFEASLPGTHQVTVVADHNGLIANAPPTSYAVAVTSVLG